MHRVTKTDLVSAGARPAGGGLEGHGLVGGWIADGGVADGGVAGGGVAGGGVAGGPQPADLEPGAQSGFSEAGRAGDKPGERAGESNVLRLTVGSRDELLDALAGIAADARPNTRTDANPVAHSAATPKAGPGANPVEILLAPGDYGELALDTASAPWARFAGPVILRAADPTDPAVLTGLALRGVGNLAFEDLRFAYDALPGAPSWAKPFTIENGTGIAFRRVTFEGDIAEGLGPEEDGLPTGIALWVTRSEGITVADTSFTSWHRAAVFNTVEGIALTGNEVHDIRSDGFNFSAVQDVLVAENSFRDFRPSIAAGDHADMIQIWAAAGPSRQVTIADNWFDSAGGAATQSIFLRNETVDLGEAGPEAFYEDITITGNVIHNGHRHGITVGETRGLVITDNTLIQNAAHADRGAIAEPTIRVAAASDGVTVTGNVAHGIAGVPGDGASGWQVAENLIVQADDPTAPGYLGHLFFDPFAGAEAEHADLTARPEGPVEAGGFGAAATRFDPAPAELTARFVAEIGADGALQVDAGLTANAAGPIPRGAAAFHWAFGDGTEAEGQHAAHRYAAPGTYDVTLTVRHVDGRVDASRMAVEIPDPLLLDLAVIDGRLVDRSAFAAALPAAPIEDGAIRLGSETGVRIDNEAVPQIFGLPAFGLSFVFRAPEGAGGAGEILRIHTALHIALTEAGGVSVRFEDAAGGEILLATGPAGLSDGAWHAVTLAYEAGGRIELSVDGALVADAPAGGPSQSAQAWDLTLGAAVGHAGAEVALGAVELTGEAPGAEEVAVLHAALIEARGAVPDMPQDGEAGETPDGGVGGGASSAPRTADSFVFAASLAEPPGASADIAHGSGAGAGWSLLGDAAFESGALQLDGDGDALRLSLPVPLAEADAIALALDVRAAPGGVEEAARPVWRHGAFGLEVGEDGLLLRVGREGGGMAEVALPGAALSEGTWHRLALAIDTEADRLAVSLDGVMVAERTDLDLAFADPARPLSLGGVWGRDFAGEIRDLVLVDGALWSEALEML